MTAIDALLAESKPKCDCSVCTDDSDPRIIRAKYCRIHSIAPDMLEEIRRNREVIAELLGACEKGHGALMAIKEVDPERISPNWEGSILKPMINAIAKAKAQQNG